MRGEERAVLIEGMVFVPFSAKAQKQKGALLCGSVTKPSKCRAEKTNEHPVRETITQGLSTIDARVIAWYGITEMSCIVWYGSTMTRVLLSNL